MKTNTITGSRKWAQLGITKWLKEDLSATIYQHTVNGGTFQFPQHKGETA